MMKTNKQKSSSFNWRNKWKDGDAEEQEISPRQRNWPPLQKLRAKRKRDFRSRETPLRIFSAALCLRNYINAICTHICMYLPNPASASSVYLCALCVCVCVCVGNRGRYHRGEVGVAVLTGTNCQVSIWSRQTFSAFFSLCFIWTLMPFGMLSHDRFCTFYFLFQWLIIYLF